MKQQRPLAEGDWVNHDSKFVDQPAAGKAYCQIVASNVQVSARLLFPAVDLFWIDFADESDVLPILLFFDALEGFREDDPIHIID